MITTWMMSIVGVICLSALADVIMDDGETKKYVKCVTAIIIFAVIISPLPKLFSSDFDLSDLIYIDNETVAINEAENINFLYETKKKQLDNLSLTCNMHLNEKGYSGIAITSIVSYDKPFDVVEIVVDKTQIVINDLDVNININEELKSIIASHFGVDENIIRIVG